MQTELSAVQTARSRILTAAETVQQAKQELLVCIRGDLSTKGCAQRLCGCAHSQYVK